MPCGHYGAMVFMVKGSWAKVNQPDFRISHSSAIVCLIKRWIIKNRYGFLKWWGLGQTHSLFEYQLMLSIETKVCLLYRIPFLDFVILLMMYSWSVVDTGFMNLNCFQFHPFLDMEILRKEYTYFSGWALFSSPKGSLIASFTFVPEPLITTPKLDF